MSLLLKEHEKKPHILQTKPSAAAYVPSLLITRREGWHFGAAAGYLREPVVSSSH